MLGSKITPGIDLLLFAAVLMAAVTGCNNEGNKNSTLFNKLSPAQTNIHFTNKLEFRKEFNIYRYRNFYNGGGVSLGDINGDGRLDVFFTSNQGNNRLYLNKGEMVFEDITKKAGVAGRRAWSTGASMADVNGDGYLDIYVCNSGIVEGDDQKNELYINNGDSTFTEKAEQYGIADDALSIHGSFFDYDKDGDLDLYLANNSYRAIGSFDQETADRNSRDPKGGDKLYRNDGGHFTNVSEEAGIYSSEIGFALGISVADVNRDRWPDMYISNDFFERDYLYINNRDGTFREVLEQSVNSISAASMGADIADLNNDGYPEIFVTDMLPEPESRLKLVTTFDSWERYRKYVKNGFHHQFTRNTLQLNNGDGTFSEVGRYAGIEATDWSWGANIADFDLDGKRDIFVANGIYQDLTNLDYLKDISREQMVKKIVRDDGVDFKKLIDMIPSTPIANYAFRNLGNMQFADSSASWGLNESGFSNGSAYGDMDNDGDLDLIINNIGSKASVYENRVTDKYPRKNWLQLVLKGESPNTYALGTQVTAWHNENKWFAEQMPVRGFQSTMDHRLHFGLGEVEQLDSLVIRWTDGSISRLQNVKTNQRLEVNIAHASDKTVKSKPKETTGEEETLVQDVTAEFDLEWRHRENNYSDFKREPLLFHMRSAEGPALCVGDVNGDGWDDFYAGGAKGQAGTLFVQTPDSKFDNISPDIFKEDASSEDTDCRFFDANSDGLLDLYVASGGSEFPSSSSSLADRLYFNRGKMNFEKSEQPLPGWSYESTSAVRPADFDCDGDMDLFIGVRLQPFSVGAPTRGYVLQNDGSGTFEDVSEKVAPDMLEMGMTTDAEWADINKDGYPELWTVGEWMPLTLFSNEEGVLTQIRPAGLDSTNGWWRSVSADDLDKDGDLDLIAGNYGLNSRFSASRSRPVEMWTGDFNKNGTLEQLISTYKGPRRYPMALRHDLIEEIPSLESTYPTYKSFAGKTIEEMFTDQQLNTAHYSSVYQLASVVVWNEGNADFRIEELPFRAQLSPAYSVSAMDLNGSENKEIVMGGNLHRVKPEIGRYDASYGNILSGKENGYKNIGKQQSGFSIQGEVRAIKTLNLRNGDTILMVARNNDSLKIFKINRAQ